MKKTFRQCIICGTETATRHSRYCEYHYGGKNAPRYECCPATVGMVKSAMLTHREADLFNLLAVVHKLSDQPETTQPLWVNWFLVYIQIRREMASIRAGEGDASKMNALVKTHLSLAQSLNIVQKGRGTSVDPSGAMEFLTGADEGEELT